MCVCVCGGGGGGGVLRAKIFKGKYMRPNWSFQWRGGIQTHYDAILFAMRSFMSFNQRYFHQVWINNHQV